MQMIIAKGMPKVFQYFIPIFVLSTLFVYELLYKITTLFNLCTTQKRNTHQSIGLKMRSL